MIGNPPIPDHDRPPGSAPPCGGKESFSRKISGIHLLGRILAVTVWFAVSYLVRKRCVRSHLKYSTSPTRGADLGTPVCPDIRQVPPMDHGPAIRQSAEPSAPATPLAEGPVASHRAERAVRLHVPGSWPLLVVLAVQAILSLRLVRADTAFQDEALYLWAGHLEWANVLHGTPIPQFPSYFSGAPVIYPPLAALADSLGGLTGARILSLAFMLGATVALWATARPAVRAPGRVLRGRAVRRPRPDAAPGLVRHLRCHVDVPGRARQPGSSSGPGTGRTRPSG